MSNRKAKWPDQGLRSLSQGGETQPSRQLAQLESAAVEYPNYSTAGSALQRQPRLGVLRIWFLDVKVLASTVRAFRGNHPSLLLKKFYRQGGSPRFDFVKCVACLRPSTGQNTIDVWSVDGMTGCFVLPAPEGRGVVRCSWTLPVSSSMKSPPL